MFEFNALSISLLVLGWSCSYWIALIIVSFDKDVETYQIDWQYKIAVFILWPFYVLYYGASFIGNLLGKAYRWSK